MGSAHGPGGLLRHRPWRHWILGSALARLPTTMAGLAVMLAGERVTGSLAEGAVLAGLLTLCSGPPGPLLGRLFDRVDLRRALRITVAVTGLAAAGLAAVAEAHAPGWTLYALCVPLGLATAGMWGGMRALLVAAVPAVQLRRAHFAESLLVELCAVVGPALVSVLLLAGGVGAALAGMAVLSLLGAWFLRAVPSPDSAPDPASDLAPDRAPDPPEPVGLLPPRDIWPPVALALAAGLGFGLIMANVPLRVATYGLDSVAAGWFTAVLPAGACLGGLVVSVRPVARRRALPAALAFLLVSAALAVPSAVAGGALGYGLGLFAASLFMVPLNGLIAAEMEARIGRRRRAEAFSYFGSAVVGGGSAGYFLTGALAGHLDPAAVGLLGPAAFLLPALVLGGHLVRRRRTAEKALD